MSFGLQFINAGGAVTLDSEFSRLSVIYAGAYAPTEESGLGSTTTFPAPITTQEPPLVFLRPTTVVGVAVISLVRVNGSPGNWTGFYVRTESVNTAQPNGKYFAAVFASKLAATFGLRIWDGSANLLFDNGSQAAVFTRAYQNWTFKNSVLLSDGVNYRNTYAVPTSFPDGEYILANTFGMPMVAGNVMGRQLGNRWDFTAGEMQAYTTATSNPRAFYLPALFAKLTA